MNIFSTNPSNGLEYNQINDTHHVSKKLWRVDIARTPQIIKSMGECVDVHAEAYLANRYNSLVDYKASKVHGRRR